MADYSMNIEMPTEYVKGVEDVKQSWGIILSTIPGTVPLQPNFGSNLYSYMDQPINKAFSSMANTIIKDLEKWETRAKISKVTRTLNGSQIIIIIEGIYKPTGKQLLQTVEIVDNGNGGIGYMIIGSTFLIR